MEMDNSVFNALKYQAEYYLNSRSLTGVYETYGGARMAFNLGAISWQQFQQLNKMLVTDGINNAMLWITDDLQGETPAAAAAAAINRAIN